jgi:hypothetical protein
VPADSLFTAAIGWSGIDEVDSPIKDAVEEMGGFTVRGQWV